RLSNELCSLNPHQDRLCYSMIVKMDREGKLMKKWIGRTVICSDYRFTYEEVQQIIEGQTHPCREALGVLNNLARKMRQVRDEKGALCFNQPEVCFDMDEEGKPLRVYLKEMREANRMIEEWMLLANRIIAETIGKEKKGKTVFIYRIHGVPTVERLHIFRHLAGRMGLKVQGKLLGKHSPPLAKLIQQIGSDSMRSMVEGLFIRTLAKAAYSVDNIGHYGLAFDYYTHFTSPIRRYSDLIVHRLLGHYLNGGRSVRRDKYWEICRHVSEMEVVAENAERASVRYKQLEYLGNHVEKVWTGKITEIVRWGFYVELDEIRCEGLVSILNMKDDYYEFQKKTYK
ncbi:MAG: RNB domain-containing ribonuclease, partial [Odoribacter sp.]|nr:RNB domain-containing ribonuclease [Odoribacter sp.]